MKPSIVWFRHDLRTEDNPALIAAAEKGGPIIPVYIWAPEEEGKWPIGAASRWWLHGSLLCLQKDLKALGLSLVIRFQPSLPALKQLIQKTGADALYFNRRYEPHALKRDAEIRSELHHAGIQVESFNGSLLIEPWESHNKQGKPFQVFTPFWKHFLAQKQLQKPLSKLSHAQPYEKKVESVALDDLDLLPHIHWDAGLKEAWIPGTKGAHQQLKRTLFAVVENYARERDYPAHEGTSLLSPYLHFGELSPRQIWHAVAQQNIPNADAYLRQLGWREFAYHLLYHFPETPQKPLKESFKAFSWENNATFLKAWQKGLTGYPIVDAGMRQLWKTGWMHNRVRMIVASFLVKDLRINWLEGAKWFWDTLVDADLANNTLGWQWVAGCGADAAPYFRIFNPVTQAEKFDPEGDYVRRWVPEIKALPNKWLHKPWAVPDDQLQKAGIILGETYPYPIVDHAEARIQALAALNAITH